MNSVSRGLLHGLGEHGELVPFSDGVRVHRTVAEPLAAMTRAAARAGIGLRVWCGVRTFEEQLAVWNAKADGSRALLDSDGRALDARALSPDALIDAILRWSAMPGASRHHWGTDLDVFDAAVVGAGFEPAFTPEESVERFSALHRWLDAHMGEFGFFRPYASDLGGIAPEPWHLSYAPLALTYLPALSVDGLRAVLASATLAHGERVAERLPELFERFVLRIASPTDSQRSDVQVDR